MRVLVTGGTGWIGSHLCRLLVAAGHRVILRVRSTTHLGPVEDLASRMTVQETSQTPEEVDICVHLAWYAEPSRYLDAPENLSSLGDSLSLLRSLEAARCKRIVAVGTCLEYAIAPDPLAEESPLAPRSLYATCKDAFRRVAEKEARLQGKSFAWARIFHLYGPGERQGRLVPRVARALLGGEVCELSPGTQVRDFLHVDDVARAIWTVARSSHDGAINIGSSAPTTVAQVAHLIGDLTGHAELLRFTQPAPDEPACIVADARQLRSLGWAPLHTLREGLAETLSWWRGRACEMRPAATS